MNEEQMTFTILNDNGEETTCEVLFTFESEETNKNYIVYTDNTVDENGETCVYASTYDPDVDEMMLLPIETDEEWDMIDEIMQQLLEDLDE